MKQRWIGILAALLLVGCSSTAQRRLQPAEDALKTDGPTTMLFHSALYYPEELSLKFDGYIVGVEKSPRGLISVADDIRTRAILDAGLDDEGTRSKIVDSKLLFISHIIENHRAQDGRSNCTLHNAYALSTGPRLQQLTPPCRMDGEHPPVVREQAYKSSWQALDSLRSSVRRRVDSGQYTDILVITMGWNTVQEEAIRNFNSIVFGLRQAGGESFRPLVIGVTWPSQWQSEWLAPLYKFFSFPTKSADADELGLTWLGVLLHDTLPGVTGRLPVTVIGHSFGSRAASMAACVGPAIVRTDGEIRRSRIDNLVNLQGAFLANRLFGDRDKGVRYPENCSNVGRVILTSSVRDDAMNNALWGLYAGDERAYRQYCGQGAKINCVTAKPAGDFDPVHTNPESNITYVNADALIHENAYLSGGGAHSDIYRREHGALIMGLIKGSAPAAKVK